MNEQYNTTTHVTAIEEQNAAEVDSARAEERSAKAESAKDQQVRLRLDEIYHGIKSVQAEVASVNERIPDSGHRPLVGPIANALADGLIRLARVAPADATSPAQRASIEIQAFISDNASQATIEEVAAAIADITAEVAHDPPSYAEAVYRRVAHEVLDPGRNLPHKMEALQRARQILAAAPMSASQGANVGGGGAGLPSNPPSTASTEILRDVSHLTTLLLGSSPAFADAMRMQSDAIAYSLAAFNKVGDMQRQDALGLAITARAAATEFDRS